MKKFFFVLGFLMVVLTATATSQVSASVTWKGKTFHALLEPGMVWDASPNTPRPYFDVNSTANDKGYDATWEVKDGILYLDSFDATKHGKKVGLSQLFPGKKLPVKAWWVSSLVILGQGKIIAIDSTNNPVYADEIYMHFKQGKLIRTEKKAGDPRISFDPILFTEQSSHQTEV